MTDTKELKPCPDCGSIPTYSSLNHRKGCKRGMAAFEKDLESMIEQTAAALSPDTVTLSREEFERVKHLILQAHLKIPVSFSSEFEKVSEPLGEALAILEKHGEQG